MHKIFNTLNYHEGSIIWLTGVVYDFNEVTSLSQCTYIFSFEMH